MGPGRFGTRLHGRRKATGAHRTRFKSVEAA